MGKPPEEDSEALEVEWGVGGRWAEGAGTKSQVLCRKQSRGGGRMQSPGRELLQEFLQEEQPRGWVAEEEAGGVGLCTQF